MSDLAELYKALADFQAELPQITKGNTAQVPTKSGGQYSYRYADLADVSRVVLPVLAKHGLSWTCAPTTQDGQLVLRWTLAHESGQTLGGVYPIGSGSPQQVGGLITYARRYCLVSATGVAPADDDDDAQAAERAWHEQRRSRPDSRRNRSQTAVAPEQVSAPLEDPDQPARPTASHYMSALHLNGAELKDFSARVVGHDVEGWAVMSPDDQSQVLEALDLWERTGTDPTSGTEEQA